MRLIQFISSRNQRQVGKVENGKILVLNTVRSVYELFSESLSKSTPLPQLAETLLSTYSEDYDRILSEKRVLVPLDHPDAYHTWITGTGLTHIGSAASRNAMHEAVQDEKKPITDSMKMFRMGVEHGKMKQGVPGVQPEWFYKGNGLSIVHPEHPIHSPSFALDGGEEPEVAGLYMIDKHGVPNRVGFALGNEFSDHKMERINYLYLAHSKLRPCSFGPEILLDELPATITGKSRILRDKKVLWEKDFTTGEQNMTHNLANLEYHHFKYDLFRQPGDVHIHFFGTSVLSFSDQVEARSGDTFEIEAAVFGKPLRNPLVTG